MHQSVALAACTTSCHAATSAAKVAMSTAASLQPAPQPRYPGPFAGFHSVLGDLKRGTETDRGPDHVCGVGGGWQEQPGPDPSPGAGRHGGHLGEWGDHPPQAEDGSHGPSAGPEADGCSSHGGCSTEPGCRGAGGGRRGSRGPHGSSHGSRSGSSGGGSGRRRWWWAPHLRGLWGPAGP